MTALSPVHEMINGLSPSWGQIANTPIALHFGAPEVELNQARCLALCDVSAFPKLGIKGPQAYSWLKSQGIQPPTEIYGVVDLADGGILAKIAANEFFLESGIASSTVEQVSTQLGSAPDGCYRVEQENGAFLLSGSHYKQVMAQACAVDLAEAPTQRMVYCRVAATSCGLLPDSIHDIELVRIWVDPSLAVYLWQTLAQITDELGGKIIGAQSYYPDLA